MQLNKLYWSISLLQIKKSLQELLVEANSKKVHLEILNDRCEVLMDYSAHTPVRDMTVQLQSLYANVLTNLQVCTIHLSQRIYVCCHQMVSVIPWNVEEYLFTLHHLYITPLGNIDKTNFCNFEWEWKAEIFHYNHFLYYSSCRGSLCTV